MNKRIKVKKNGSLVAKYTERAIEKISEMGAGEGIYAYRGQENAGWPVESAAYRRIESALGTPPDLEMFIRHHEIKLLEPARMNGYGFKDGRTLSDLELLADLQHHGAATCLIDFTCNLLVALWFACTDSTNSDGRLFIMNTNNPNIFLSPEQGDLECSIRKLLTFKTRNENREDSFTSKLKSAEYWHWSPHGINPRILKQDGLFIFGKMSISNDENLQHIVIDQADKAALANELRVWGVSREMLFKDLPGFASSQAVSVPIQIWSMSADELIRAGNAATQKGEAEKAIQLYDEAESKLVIPNADLFVSRGSVKYTAKKYNSAVEDYTKAIEIDPENIGAYLLRGLSNYHMGSYDSSITDFTKAGKFEVTKYIACYFRGMVNSKMNKHNDAILDYTKAIEFNPKSRIAHAAYLERGNENAVLGKHGYAIIDYNRAIELDPTDYNVYHRRGVSNYSLANYDDAIKDFTKFIDTNKSNFTAYLGRGCAYLQIWAYADAKKDFTKSINIDPNHEFGYYFRSAAQLALGNRDESITDLQRALELAKIRGNDKFTRKIQEELKQTIGEE